MLRVKRLIVHQCLVLVEFLYFGFIAGTAMLPSDVAAYTVPLLLSCIALFVGGLGEDIGRDVSPKTRLILSFISAL